MFFKDRKDAGQKLASKLQEYKNNSDALVLALPRGGIILAYEIAKELNLPLDVIIAQKIGAPNFQELAVGAICEDGEVFFEDEIISSCNASKEYLDLESSKKQKEAKRRADLYRKNLKPLDLKNKKAILVDDGIATGSTMLAAIKSAKAKKAKEVIVAVPVIAFDSIKKIKNKADKLIFLDAPQDFSAVGQFYDNFEQITDDIVVGLLEKSKREGK